MHNFHNTLYLVANRVNESINSFLDKIEMSICGGVDVVQLRAKKTDESEYIRIANIVGELVQGYKRIFLVNDNPLIAKKTKADGVHIGQTDGVLKNVREFLGPKAIIGRSIESIEQAKKEKEELFDYFAISPVFYTSTKRNANNPLGVGGAATIRELISKPLFAIGGIKTDNFHILSELGLNGICVVSAILDAENPQLEAKKFKKLMNESN